MGSNTLVDGLVFTRQDLLRLENADFGCPSRSKNAVNQHLWLGWGQSGLREGPERGQGRIRPKGGVKLGLG